MLDVLRKSTGSWVIKILFGLLILSFGVWGVGDMINNAGRGQAAIAVGDMEVGANELRQEFSTEMDRVVKMMGERVRTNDFMRQSVLGSVVRRLADKAALNQAAEDLDIVVTDKDLATYIAKIPAFQNDQGQFDRNLYTAALARAQLTQGGFESMMRDEFRRVQIIDTIAIGTHTPQPMTEAALHLQEDTRTVWAITLENSSIPKPAAPSDEELAKFYELRKDAFMAPEYRAVTAITLTADSVRDRVEIADADIQAAYDQRLDQYTTPASRTVSQLIFEAQDAADKAKALIAEGKTFEEVAAATGISALPMGDVPKSSLPANAADAVYGLAIGGMTDPIQSPLGWHVFTVTAATPETVKPLDAVRQELTDALIKERATDAIYRVSAELDDAIGGGATLEEAATQLKLKTIKIEAMDSQGKDRKGNDLTGIAANKEFIGTVFTSDIGLESGLVEYPQGFYILRVDTVTEAAVRPLDEVRAQVVAMWQGSRISLMGKEKADGIAEQLKNGASPESLGAKMSEPFTRTGDPAAVPAISPNLAQQAFAQPIGGVVVSGTDTGFIIAKVAAETKANPAAQQQAMTDLRNRLADQLSNDLALSYINAVSDRYGVRVNQGVINSAVK